jgi:acetylornithine/N-succinyldiaminopimelate aminotransferase
VVTPVMPTYARTDLQFESGKGPYLKTVEGETYLDFTAGIAVMTLGHEHPHLVKALTDQAASLWHTSNLYRIPGQERAAERLIEATFADTVFFANSGAEAMECAIKTARRYHWSKDTPERTHIITFEGAFHGRTLATLAAGGQAKHLEGFDPKMGGFVQLPYGDIDAVNQTIRHDTAAILVEPIQGEGGICLPPADFLACLRDLCDAHGLLLILDEVQTGVGRTGHFFAHQASGIEPDILATAKALGGGFPVGACLATADAAKGMVAGTHGSTFGGNPLAMAAVNAVLDIVLEEGFLAQVKTSGEQLKHGVQKLVEQYPTLLEEVRGQGLMLGLKCKIPNTNLVSALRSQNMLVVPAGDNVVRLLPPLNITDTHIEDALKRLQAACKALS